MTKKGFLKKLKSKLEVLEENEIKDILDEYETIIDDKIKSGETEEDAIKEFGDIEELANEILKAYKINPKYNEDDVNSFDSLIKKGAKKLTEFTKNITSDIKDNNISVETIFEIALKAIALLFILALLRLAFELISSLGESILDIMIFPIDKILIFVYNIFVWVLYIIACILIGISLFRENIKSSKNEAIIDEPKNTKSESKKEKVKEVKEKTKSKEEKNSESGLLTKILKVTTTIVFLFPLWCIVIGLCVVLSILIYYTVTGVNLFGVALIIIGLITFISAIISVINKIFQGGRTPLVCYLIIGTVLIVLGTFMTIDTFSKFEYVEDVSGLNLNITTNTMESTINEKLYIDECNKVIDDNIENNKVLIEYSYYSDIIDVYNYKNGQTLHFDYNVKENNSAFKLYNIVIDNLKNKKIYNYSNLRLFEIKKTVYVNSTDAENVYCR